MQLLKLFRASIAFLFFATCGSFFFCKSSMFCWFWSASIFRSDSGPVASAMAFVMAGSMAFLAAVAAAATPYVCGPKGVLRKYEWLRLTKRDPKQGAHLSVLQP